MKITLPIYVETIHDPKEKEHLFRVRPLFFPQPRRQHRSLDRALARLADDLRCDLGKMGKALRHDELAAYSFCPDLEHHRLDLTLELRHHRARGRFLFVAFAALGRRLAFTPAVPEVWFDLQPGERLEDRATEVLTRHFREREKEDEDHFLTPEDLSLAAQAWVSTLELDDLHPAQEIFKAPQPFFALMGGEERVDGDAELERVGRCLNRLYPDELERAFGREKDLTELTRLLEARDHRPVLMIGPRLVGKTALLHEYVYRKTERRRSPYAARDNVWLLSPQRLISGMSYVGQWENRLLAILKAVRKRAHLLYFADLLGLFHAGISSCSQLSVAHVLKPYLERRDVRLVAEITPEAFQVLREQDRSFAELFHLLPLAECAAADNLRILIRVQRELEGRHNCRFALDVLPTVLDLQRRYAREAVFPGKAAVFLQQLAVKGRNADVTRATALDEFHARSGLGVTFLDTRARLARAGSGGRPGPDDHRPERGPAGGRGRGRHRQGPSQRSRPSVGLVPVSGPYRSGQDPVRKALAGYLFGDPDKVLRFDMNEYVTPDAVTRLVGTFANPEGLLTSALRHQPFAVVLLDEIEKAYPDVFDLLLQVLGEGRLTDALGRTVDFTNALVILTSNLGVREAEQSIGFLPKSGEAARPYVQAAERFFRPEFFNRLDRIVPFGRLARDDVRRIARRLIQDVFQREGLLRRRCILQVEERVLEQVVDLGYDPHLGACALKRAIERHLTRPVAARLASEKPGRLTVIRLHPGPELMAVHVQELIDAVPLPRSLPLFDRDALLAQIEASLRRIEDEARPLRPGGEIVRANLKPEHDRYFILRGQIDRLRDQCRAISAEWDAGHSLPRWPTLPVGPLFRRKKGFHLRTWRTPRHQGSLLQDMASAEDMHLYLRDLSAHAVLVGDEMTETLQNLLYDLALAQLIADCCTTSAGEQVLLYVQSEFDSLRQRALANLYVSLFASELQLESALVPGTSTATLLVIRGPHAEALARLEEGTHLFCPAHENLVPVQVGVLPLSDEENPSAAFAEVEKVRSLWLEKVAAGLATPEDDPQRLRPVLRVYEEEGSTIDLRTGQLVPTFPSPEAREAFSTQQRLPVDLVDALHDMILGVLPLPPEFQELAVR